MLITTMEVLLTVATHPSLWLYFLSYMTLCFSRSYILPCFSTWSICYVPTVTLLSDFPTKDLRKLLKIPHGSLCLPAAPANVHAQVCHGVPGKVKGQLLGASYLRPPCEFWELNSGSQAQQREPLPTQPLCWSHFSWQVQCYSLAPVTMCQDTSGRLKLWMAPNLLYLLCFLYMYIFRKKTNIHNGQSNRLTTTKPIKEIHWNKCHVFVNSRNKRSLWSYCVLDTAAPGFRTLEGDVVGTSLSSWSVCST